MSHLKITLVQAKLAWEDPAANRAYFDQRLASIRGTTDLVVLPEMFTTGFTMNAASLAESMDGVSVPDDAGQRVLLQRCPRAVAR